VVARFPQLKSFENELQFIEKASQVSLENILSDLHDLEKGMELTKKESEFLRQKNEINPVSDIFGEFRQRELQTFISIHNI